jgi:hypothetical protein
VYGTICSYAKYKKAGGMKNYTVPAPTTVLGKMNPCARNINPLTPELNPSEQPCLPGFLLGILNFNAYS